MDTATLVEQQTEDGPKLIAEIQKDGFSVLGAYWLYTEEAGQWYFYIVSDDLLKGGTRSAYLSINEAMARLSNLSIDPFEVKIVGSNDRVAKAIKDVRSQLKPPLHARVRGLRFGDVDIEHAYIYNF